MTYKTFISIFIGVFIFTLNMNAQKDFSKLSPKQRIKLGKKEQKEAKNDPQYLKLMDEGLAFFQLKEYDKALSKYQQAHDRRPQNVYPLIMIDDVEVAKDVLTVLTKPETEVTIDNNDLNAKPPEYKKQESNINNIAEEKEEENLETIETQSPDPDPEPIVINTPENLEKKTIKSNKPVTLEKKEEKVYDSDGIYRETFKEASATIHQVTIVNKGVSTVIRQVVHTWGGVFYFKNKDAISKQEYEKLIEEIDN